MGSGSLKGMDDTLTSVSKQLWRWTAGQKPRLIRCGFHRSRINCWMIWCSLSVSSTDMVLKFLMGVDTYTGNLRNAIDMCMGMRRQSREGGVRPFASVWPGGRGPRPRRVRCSARCGLARRVVQQPKARKAVGRRGVDPAPQLTHDPLCPFILPNLMVTVVRMR